MAGKRSATTELNHDNWDEENKPEEAGVFTKAPDEILEKRVLKTARRRLPPRDGSAQSAFSTLTAFKAGSSATNSSPFSFLANATTVSSQASPIKTNASPFTASATNGATTKNTENGASKKEESSDAIVSKTFASKSEKEGEKGSKKPTEYFAKLKGLNESVAQWIKTHVDANPFCILTPIFRDYEKYLKDIESKHGSETDKTVKTSDPTQAPRTTESSIESPSTEKKLENTTFGVSSASPPMSGEWKREKSIFGNVTSNAKFMFGKTEQAKDSLKSVFGSPEQSGDSKSIFGNIDKSAKGVFSNEKNPFLSKPSGVSDSKSDETTKSDSNTSSTSFSSSHTSGPIFSFGQSPATSNVTAGFSFGSAKPFSFAAQAVKPQESEDKGDDGKEDEDEEPPKPEIKPVTEEGAVYEQRCKVFVKKDGNFSDRGVGMLFLKPTPNGKTQLIVRAETSLGNLLLNTLLTESIPLKRMNKNTIMLVCLPKPESSPPPVPVLLRVKTDADADALLENLNKHKK